MNKTIQIILLVTLIIAGIIFFTVGIFWLTPKVFNEVRNVFKNDTVYLTNDQIIFETQKCENAGLKASQTINGWNYKVRSVTCR